MPIVTSSKMRADTTPPTSRDGGSSNGKDSPLGFEEEEDYDEFENITENNKNQDIDREKIQVHKLTKSENRHVQVWRVNVIILLLIKCALVTTLTYIFLKREDSEDFETSFRLFSKTIAENIEFRARSLMDATQGVSELLTSEAQEQGMEWPFVSLTSFDVYVQHTSARSNAESVIFAPFVQPDQVKAWSSYAMANQGWIAKGLNFSAATEEEEGRDSEALYAAAANVGDILPAIFHIDFDAETGSSDFVFDNGSEETCCGPDFPLVPVWQISPAPQDSMVVNYNTAAIPEYREVYEYILQTRGPAMHKAGPNPLAELTLSAEKHARMHHLPNIDNLNTTQMSALANQIPHSVLVVPIFEELHKSKTSNIVGVAYSVLAWDSFIRNTLPPEVSEFHAVIENSCGQAYTFSIKGQDVTYLGEGNLHDKSFEDLVFDVPVSDFFGQTKGVQSDENCLYWYRIYPSYSFHDVYRSRTPIVFAIVIIASFLLMSGAFFIYDLFVVRKNNKIIEAAAQSSAIVSSLFPSTVRDRLYGSVYEDNANNSGFKETTGRNKLQKFLTSNENNNTLLDIDETETSFMSGNHPIRMSKPIADLFPETTIMFADLVGFTAWSSMREPSQVFILLETIYSAFDKIAKRRRVFKVETIGDCYVAVTGLPDPRKDHAVAMARFANECLLKLQQLTQQLETVLGPDTSSLNMRIGLHSGPVTAGVLRGERSRFQLFGDTMNTASRMESTGKAGRIQVSQETADQITGQGKLNWLERREDVVVAKGKGEVVTYWLNLSTFSKSADTSSSGSSDRKELNRSKGNSHVEAHDKVASASKAVSTPGESDSDTEKEADQKTTRLIQWNVDVLNRLLKQLVARRKCRGRPSRAASLVFEKEINNARGRDTPLEEVVDIITLPKFEGSVSFQSHNDETSLGSVFEAELQDYVTSIAMMYRNNPFHNFEHASHVTMSVVKLLARIVAPIDFQPNENDDNSDDNKDESDMRTKYEHTLHDHTYGITSDPLTQFSCVLSALVHDVDHSGVPNAQLVKEKQTLCRLYKDRSVAEQNSVDLAWELLMDPSYSNLRAVIYTDGSEMRRFRQLLVNSVMATDIMDKELGAQRKARWNVAFANDASKHLSRQQRTNQKATIVIEHLIQASDVAHTMQHWHIYRKWNERLYTEMHKAYVEGRAEKDPAEFWYKGEIGFFDFYIIPLAKKLKDCGVFGVSSDEYLQYAEKNRQEWEIRGEQIVAEMSQTVMNNTTTPRKEVP